MVLVQVVERVDTVVYATGYVYSFPFLDGTNIVTVEDNRFALDSIRRCTWQWLCAVPVPGWQQ